MPLFQVFSSVWWPFFKLCGLCINGRCISEALTYQYGVPGLQWSLLVACASGHFSPDASSTVMGSLLVAVPPNTFENGRSQA
jgi:hypothetical protein